MARLAIAFGVTIPKARADIYFDHFRKLTSEAWELKVEAAIRSLDRFPMISTLHYIRGYYCPR